MFSKSSLFRILKISAVWLLALVLIYSTGRFFHVALGSLYTGERAPYLQMASPSAMTIRWQSRQANRGGIRYGLTPYKLSGYLQEESLTEKHELRLQGLRPATRYYYAVFANEKLLYGGNDYWFVTPPDRQPAQQQSVRIWVTGDQGYAGPAQEEVRDSMLAWLEKHPRPDPRPDPRSDPRLDPNMDQAGRPAANRRVKDTAHQAYLDMWLTTGDNAYRSGTNEQFQAGFFLPYEKILRNIPVWPVYGNHDARRWAFFDIFSFPQQAESGGLASGTEHYYSVDYANLHIVILDSQSESMQENSEMLKWLEQDLQLNRQKWLIAAFHHPPYTRGSHNSDSYSDSGGRLFDVREKLLPVLEQAGMDLVLSGHSHMYERSYLLGCHYGVSESLDDSMILNKETKMGGIYRKPGTVYAVVGSSSKLDRGTLDHPAMAVAKHEMGSMLIDIVNNKLTARFIRRDGEVSDEFSIIKHEDDAVKTVQCQP